MPSNLDALEAFLPHKILYCPGKAVNAEGVATSGQEMTQNAGRLARERHEADARLRIIMSEIHNNCVRYGERDHGFCNYVMVPTSTVFSKWLMPW